MKERESIRNFVDYEQEVSTKIEETGFFLGMGDYPMADGWFGFTISGGVEECYFRDLPFGWV